MSVLIFKLLPSSDVTVETVSAGCVHTVGLKADGTVVAAGDDIEWQSGISEWKDIVAVYAGCDYTVGLKSDGTVVATGKDNCNQCNVKNWKSIKTE